MLENQYVNYVLILLTIIFFILSLNIKIKEITKILLFPFSLLKKIINFLNKNKKNNIKNADQAYSNVEFTNSKINVVAEKQPILPFATTNEVNNKKNINSFKLPSINFLEKNHDLKNRKKVNEN